MCMMPCQSSLHGVSPLSALPWFIYLSANLNITTYVPGLVEASAVPLWLSASDQFHVGARNGMPCFGCVEEGES